MLTTKATSIGGEKDMQLVLLENNDLFTSSLIIAEGTEVKHESVQRRIRDYEKELSTLGKVGFKIRALESGQEQKVYSLNEQQSTFLITLLRNTPIVVKFKLELVKQFFAMRKLLIERQSPHWKQTRLESKTNRRLETDEIKLFIEYAKDQGSKSAEKYYIHFTKLANKAVGISADQRDSITAVQLNTLILVENIINHCISEGMDAQTPYKNVYMMCKARIEQFREVSYLAVA